MIGLIVLNDTASSSTTSTVTLIVGILGFATAILTIIFSHINNKRNLAFLLEKDKLDREDRLKRDELEFDKDKWNRQKSYNRVLGCLLKVFRSYIVHKHYCDENGVENVPDNILPQLLDKIDHFNSDIKSLNKTVNVETEIIPELTLLLHELLDVLSRFELMILTIPSDPTKPENEKIKLIFQRAHIFAVSNLLDEYFIDIIEMLAEKAEVSDDFLKLIKEFNSPEVASTSSKTQQEITDRMMESLVRQTGVDINLNDLLLK